MLTSADIFAGGGGWSLGALAAGFTPVWAIEHDAAIAEVYAANIGAHVFIKGAQDVDARTLEPVDLLCASPPCQAHSNARPKNLAARDDAEVGMCLLDYVRILRPRFVLIENVEGWKRSAAFKAIFHGLHALGYFCNVQVLNAADFGVPQTRRRLILRASRESWLPALPAPVKWRGWYGAIEDLISTLPESKFAEWQLARMPESLASMLVDGDGNRSRPPTVLAETEPSMTIQAWHGRRPICTPRAFIVDCQDAGAVREDGERGLTIRDAEHPMFSITASQCKRVARAWLEQGRVVAMTPRALARFQAFPDEYKLPDKAGLACKVIGNAMPKTLARILCEGFARQSQ